jgi:hypothetical protein
MVRKTAENGSFYHEPPYTEEEELALYRHGPAFKMIHSNRPAPAAPARAPQKVQPQPPEESAPSPPVKK